MSETKDGGPAFPTEIGSGANPNEHQNGPRTAIWHGMSLRDYFAAKALNGMLSNDIEFHPDDGESIYEFGSRQAYLYADAMLQARNS